VGGCGAGIVEPKISVMNDVAGCADSGSNGARPSAVLDAEGSAGIVGTDGSDPVMPPVVGIDVTGTARVPGAI
jgi:hypothetical protein